VVVPHTHLCLHLLGLDGTGNVAGLLVFHILVVYIYLHSILLGEIVVAVYPRHLTPTTGTTIMQRHITWMTLDLLTQVVNHNVVGESHSWLVDLTLVHGSGHSNVLYFHLWLYIFIKQLFSVAKVTFSVVFLNNIRWSLAKYIWCLFVINGILSRMDQVSLTIRNGEVPFLSRVALYGVQHCKSQTSMMIYSSQCCWPITCIVISYWFFIMVLIQWPIVFHQNIIVIYFIVPLGWILTTNCLRLILVHCRMVTIQNTWSVLV